MAASALGGECVGFDINPLACLITEAKAAPASPTTIADVARECVIAARQASSVPQLTLRGTAVPWFSDCVAAELAQIIAWVNTLGLPRSDLLVVATALSAATRDASWIRKSGWKLHRMPEAERAARTPSAWTSFAARLRHYVMAGARHQPVGDITVLQLRADQALSNTIGRFDVILTSPPYGDSKTTVQYGAASAICLDIVSRLEGLEDKYVLGRDIDRSCLGGAKKSAEAFADLRRYWAGAPDSEGARRVSTFLADFACTCRRLANLVAPSGTLMMVVGRRSVRGFRVKLDEFAIAEMEALGYSAGKIQRRRLQQKRLPRAVNRFARATSAEQRMSGRVKTMDEEIVLTFEGPASIGVNE
jgi:hypothetical protein